MTYQAEKIEAAVTHHVKKVCTGAGNHENFHIAYLYRRNNVGTVVICMPVVLSMNIKISS